MVLYLDEITVYQQPTLTNAYAARRGDQSRGRRSYRANTPTRVVVRLQWGTG